MSGKTSLPTVVFINHWAAQLGGAEYSLLDLISALAGKADVHLFTSENGTLLDRLAPHAVQCHVIPSEPSLINVKRDHLIRSLVANIPAVIGFVRFVIRLRAAVLLLHPDCIHANVPKSHIALLLLHLSGVRSRSIIHFREIFRGKSFAGFLYRILYPLSGRTTTIIAISNAVREALPGTLRNRTEVIYNGVTVAPRPPSRTHTTPPVRFLYIGRIVPWKGCDLLIDAFTHLTARIGPHEGCLSLFGGTSYWNTGYRTKLMERIEKNDLSELVTLHDHIDSPYREYPEHDVLCMPSIDEPFGRVAAEAQACALPVIAFACGGIREIILDKGTGLLVTPGDSMAFSDAMLHFVRNPADIHTMGYRGRERAAALFNRETQLPLLLGRILG